MIERAAQIREFTLRKLSEPISRSELSRYSATAARWERLRLHLYRHASTPGDDLRFSNLTVLLRRLVADLELTTCTEENSNAHGIVGVTDGNGFLCGDPARIIYSSWSDGNSSLRPSGRHGDGRK